MEILKNLAKQEDLSYEDTTALSEAAFQGKLNSDEMITFLLSLEQKGYTPAEIAGVANGLQKSVAKHKLLRSGAVCIAALNAVEIEYYPIDIITAFIVAGCGVPVAKQLYFPVYEKNTCYKTMLESIGIHVDLSAQQMTQCLNEIGISFITMDKFLPDKDLIEDTQFKLKTHTILDVVLPMISPYNLKSYYVGVKNDDLHAQVGAAFAHMNCKHAMAVSSDDNIDVVSVINPTKIIQFDSGLPPSTYFVSVNDFGLPKAARPEIMCADIESIPAMIEKVLRGEKNAVFNMAIANTAAVLRMIGNVDSWKDGMKKARQSVKTGRAFSKYKNLQNWTKRAQSQPE